jgi:hypothetical protein
VELHVSRSQQSPRRCNLVTQRTDTATGTRLSVTCNTGVSTMIPVVTAVTAGTSFTINLGTITTNPECFSYFIVN